MTFHMKNHFCWLAGLSLFCAVPVLAVAIVAQATLTADQEVLQESASLYAKLEGIARYQIPAAATRSNVDELMVGQLQSSVTSADLQSRLRNMAAARGMQILQANEIKLDDPVKDFPSVSKVAIHFELNGNLESVSNFFLDIEQAKPWLFVERVSILSSDQDGVPQTEEPSLYVSADIWGAVPETGATPQ